MAHAGWSILDAVVHTDGRIHTIALIDCTARADRIITETPRPMPAGSGRPIRGGANGTGENVPGAASGVTGTAGLFAQQSFTHCCHDRPLWASV
jgi:hypothetical protein